MLAAALIALLVVAWATGGGGAGKIGNLFDRVIDSVSAGSDGRATPSRSWPGHRRAGARPAVAVPAAARRRAGGRDRPRPARRATRGAGGGARRGRVGRPGGAAPAPGSVRSRSPRSTCASTASADEVTATASYVDHTDVPLIGALLPDVRVSATADHAVRAAIGPSGASARRGRGLAVFGPHPPVPPAQHTGSARIRVPARRRRRRRPASGPSPTPRWPARRARAA